MVTRSHRPQRNEEGEKIYHVTSASSDFDRGPSYRLLVPAKLARIIGRDRSFSLEVTEEGLLYRYRDGEGPTPPDLPEWLR